MPHARKPARRESELRKVATQLAEAGRAFYARGWTLGTSGNFSAVLSREPLRLAITASGLDKGRLTARDILEVGDSGSLLEEPARASRRSAQSRPKRGQVERGPAPAPRPSDETKLHVAVVRARSAGAVLHTHSVWSTLLSEAHASHGGLAIEGFEMLKGLAGVRTHQHREWLPILENSQDVTSLAREVERTLGQNPGSHGFLLRGHGLYTWGDDVAAAKRHVEILEFLLEVVGRRTL